MSAVRVRHRPPAFAPAALRSVGQPALEGPLRKGICEQAPTMRRSRALARPSTAQKRRSAALGGRRLARKSRPRRPPRLDGFFELLGGAEGHLLAGLDLDRFAGRRVAPHAGGALAHLEDAEAADADAVALLEVLGYQADQIAEHRLGLLLRHFMGFREIRGEMLQGHGIRCTRFLRCHGWPSWLASGRESHPSRWLP